MSDKSSRADLVARRGELLAELFLQELDAEFIARPATDFGYDFFIGFKNPDDGVNIAAVELKATEGPVQPRYRVPKQLFRRLANSNIPVLLLVADVKENRLFYALPSSHEFSDDPDARTVALGLTEIDEKTKQELRDQLATSHAVSSAAVH